MNIKTIGLLAFALTSMSISVHGKETICISSTKIGGQTIGQDVFTASDTKVTHRFVHLGEVVWSLHFDVKNYEKLDGELKDYSNLQSEIKLEWGRILLTVSMVKGVPSTVYQARIYNNGLLESTEKWKCDK